MLIVGLGNPGDEYQGTRHNIGFEVIDILATKNGIKLDKREHLSLIGKGEIGTKKVILAKPQTYMNRSGMAIPLLIDRYGFGLNDLLIIYDDADLPLSQLRIRKAGSSGGHKGVSSIIESLGTSEFPRLRIGVGSPGEKMDLADYLLSKFNEDERRIVNQSIERAAQAVEEIVIFGIDRAMNRFNPRLDKV